MLRLRDMATAERTIMIPGLNRVSAAYHAQGQYFPRFERQKIRAFYDDDLLTGNKEPNQAMRRGIPCSLKPKPEDHATPRESVNFYSSFHSYTYTSADASTQHQSVYPSLTSMPAAAPFCSFLLRHAPSPHDQPERRGRRRAPCRLVLGLRLPHGSGMCLGSASTDWIRIFIRNATPPTTIPTASAARTIHVGGGRRAGCKNNPCSRRASSCSLGVGCKNNPCSHTHIKNV